MLEWELSFSTEHLCYRGVWCGPYFLVARKVCVKMVQGSKPSKLEIDSLVWVYPASDLNADWTDLTRGPCAVDCSIIFPDMMTLLMQFSFQVSLHTVPLGLFLLAS